MCFSKSRSMASRAQYQRKRKSRKTFKHKAKILIQKGNINQEYGISDEIYQYFVGVLERIEEDFVDDEEKEIFVNNVFEETAGQELVLCCNQLVSQVLENLLPHASYDAFQRIASKLVEDLRVVCMDPFASHVLQKMLSVAVKEMNSTTTECDNEGAAEHKRFCFKLILKVSQFVVNNLHDFIWDTYANHIIRTVLECLSGVIVNEEVMRSRRSRRQQKNVHTEELSVLPHENSPSEFTEVLKDCFERIEWPQLIELMANDLTSALLETLLLVLHKSDPTMEKCLLKTFIRKGFMAIDTNVNEFDPEESAVALFNLEPAAHLMDVALAVSPPKYYRKLYKQFFKGKLRSIAQHPVGNFTLQKLISCCDDKEKFTSILVELEDHFEEVLAIGHTGVILNLAQACRKLSEGQEKFTQALLRSFHCLGPEELQLQIVPCVCQLVTSENITHIDERVGFPIHLHGSLILQTMVNFTDPVKIVSSLLIMEPSLLNYLALDSKGSHIIDAFLTSSYIGEKSQDKLIQKLKGHFVSLSCSKYGSRCIDTIWKVANMKQKCIMVDEFIGKEVILSSNPYGKHILQKCAVSIYHRKKQDWIQLQKHEQKKRKLFGDIIEDTSELKSHPGGIPQKQRTKDRV